MSDNAVLIHHCWSAALFGIYSSLSEVERGVVKPKVDHHWWCVAAASKGP